MIQLAAELTTEFHRNLATADWLRTLEQHVEEAIAARSEFQTPSGSGRVSSQYSHQRYMGPNSAVKFHFEVEVAVDRTDRSGSDTYAISVRYLPETHSFKTKGERVATVETRQAEDRHSQQLSAVTKAAASQLRERFEKREAIYIEKGALRVRVENIRAADALHIVADVVEVPTPGFEPLRHQYSEALAADPQRGSFYDGLWERLWPRRKVLRWSIGGGYLTQWSESSWEAGYGGWSLYFAPALLQAVVEQASQWPSSLDGYGRYKAVLELAEVEMFERQRDLFPFVAIAAVEAKLRNPQWQAFEITQPVEAGVCVLESAMNQDQNSRWHVYKTPAGDLLSILRPEEVQQAGGLRPEAIAGRVRNISAGFAVWNFIPNLKFLELLHRVIEVSASTDPEFLEIARQKESGALFIADGRDPEGSNAHSDTTIGAFEIRDGQPVPGSYWRCNRYCVVGKNGLAILPPWVERALSEYLLRQPA